VPPRNGLAAFLLGLPLLLFLVLPVLALAATTLLPNTWTHLGGAQATSAILLTFESTGLATLLILLFGTPLAFWIAGGPGIVRKLAELFVVLPIAFPPAAAGIALLLAFGRSGLVNLGISFSFWAVVGAQVFVASPFYLRAAINAFRDQDRTLVQVAQADGAGEWTRAWRLTLPIASKSLTAGLAIAWARAAGEFGATIIFAGNLPGKTQTMPLAIYLGFERDFRSATALAVILLALAVVALGLSVWLTSVNEKVLQ
jgi:molybdate transport system permease protein